MRQSVNGGKRGRGRQSRLVSSLACRGLDALLPPTRNLQDENDPLLNDLTQAILDVDLQESMNVEHAKIGILLQVRLPL